VGSELQYSEGFSLGSCCLYISSSTDGRSLDRMLRLFQAVCPGLNVSNPVIIVSSTLREYAHLSCATTDTSVSERGDRNRLSLLPTPRLSASLSPFSRPIERRVDCISIESGELTVGI